MKISSGTIARTVALVIALLNQVLTALGYNPLPWSDNEIYEAVTVLATVATSIIAWWKNNSFTKNAIKADNHMKYLNESAKLEKFE
jgi:SPP1 family holin